MVDSYVYSVLSRLFGFYSLINLEKVKRLFARR